MVRTELYVLALATTLLSGLALAQPGPLVGLPAVVRTESIPSEIREYTVLDPGGAPIGSQFWRLVAGTGNCCENYLAATPDGRLFDFGGGVLWFTDDAGGHWTKVSSVEPYVFAEGAVAVAPNGDVVGTTWDGRGGDRLVSIRYVAAEDRWYYLPIPLRTPFFDRPWIGVIPGPFSELGKEVPYLVLLKGGWNTRGDAWFTSSDGLRYAPGLPSLEGARSPPREVSLDLEPNAIRDWLQPASVMAGSVRGGLVPLLGSRALMAQDDRGFHDEVLDPMCRWLALTDDGAWGCFSPPDGTDLDGRIVRVDSLGRLHSVEAGWYSVSSDGGKSWLNIPLLEDAAPAELAWWRTWDFVTNAALDVTVIAALTPSPKGDGYQTMVIKVEGPFDATPAVRLFLLGDGDLNPGSSVLALESPRFDFATVALLPDGRVAASLIDTEHPRPTLAIEFTG